MSNSSAQIGNRWLPELDSNQQFLLIGVEVEQVIQKAIMFSR